MQNEQKKLQLKQETLKNLTAQSAGRGQVQLIGTRPPVCELTNAINCHVRAIRGTVR